MPLISSLGKEGRNDRTSASKNMAPYYLQREVQSLLQAIGCIGLSWSPIKEDGSHQTSAFKNMAPYYHRREVHDLHVGPIL